MKRFSLRVLLLVTAVSGPIFAIAYIEYQPFSPKAKITLSTGADPELVEVALVNESWIPLWTELADGDIACLKLRYFGSVLFDEKTEYQVQTLPSELEMVRSSASFTAEVPPAVKKVQFGVEVSNWRGRKAIVWSEAMAIDHQSR